MTKNPNFITCGKNLRRIAKASEGRLLVVPLGTARVGWRLIRRFGLRGFLRAIARAHADYPLEEFAECNLMRRKIRLPQIYGNRIISLLYHSMMAARARLQTCAIEQALDDYPDATVVIHNGFLLPHSILAAAAKKRGRKRIFLESGFFPGTIQCDTDGINYESSLPRDPNFYRNLRFPVDAMAMPDALTSRAQKIKAVTSEKLPDHYVFVPFQVPSDMQILGLSPWIKDMIQFYDVVRELADAFPDKSFVIKEHPSFPLSVREHVEQHPRIIFANHSETRQLIAGAEAVITINSTVGIEAITLQKKVIVLGQSYYDLEGLAQRAQTREDLVRAFANLPQWSLDLDLQQRFIRFLYNVFLLHGDAVAPTPSFYDAMAARADGTDVYSSIRLKSASV